MKERIEIDGVWYIREDVTEEVNITDSDIVKFIGISYETIEYSFEATRLTNEKTGEHYSDIDIKFTDKRVKPWKEELWDNNSWFKGILEDNPDSIPALEKSLGRLGQKQFKAFLKYLQQKEWI